MAMIIFTSIYLFFFFQGDVKLLHECAVKHRGVVDKVIAKIFDKEYPRGIESVSIEELLRWQYWPIFINIYSKL